MQEISIHGNSQGWLNSHQAAEHLKISHSSFNKLVRRYHARLGDNICKQSHRGGCSGKRTLINNAGLVILANIKDSNRKSLNASDALNGKQKIAEVAISAVTPSTDPILGGLQQMLAIRQEQLDQGQRLDNLENKIEEVKRLAIEAPPEIMTNPEREYLNERVRYYAHQTEVPHWRIWGKLHSLVGRPEIGKYRSQDYKLAMKYLRTWYKEAEIEWN